MSDPHSQPPSGAVLGAAALWVSRGCTATAALQVVRETRPYWDIDTGMAALLILQTAVDTGLGACFFGLPAHKIDAFVRRSAYLPHTPR